MLIAQNPILKGYYPDPSICRVEEDYYLVNSTFSYVPGVPVFHSKDLVNWEQIGNVLEREEQLVLDGAKISQGIFAPTIRYHKGTFYMITTNVSHRGNFYVTATNPAGPWSDPIYLSNAECVAEGIDPSLFFEDDKCYYVGQRGKKNARCFGDCEVWIQELDLEKGQLVGESTALYDGSMKLAEWVEGPHLYKIGEYYYILASEQGTAYEHSLSIARSKELRGPYENYKCNPIMSHRHLGRSYPIQCTGHGDFIDTPDGKWYMVLLGTRPVDGTAQMGRETFLAEVTWEEGWPIVNVGEGRLREEQVVQLEEKPVKCPAWQKEMAWSFEEGLDKRMVFFKHPSKDLYQIEGEKEISLKFLATVPESEETAAYLAVRQQDSKFTISAQVKASLSGKEEAGLMYLHDDFNYLKVTLCVTDGKLQVCASKSERSDGAQETEKTCLGSVLFTEEEQAGTVCLSIKGENQKVSLYVNEREVARDIPTAFLSSERAGGFVGCTYGIYASGNGCEGKNRAYFQNVCVTHE